MACGFPRESFEPVVTLCVRAGHVTMLSVSGAEHPHDTCYATPLPEQLCSATLFARLVALRPCHFAAGEVNAHEQASEASRFTIAVSTNRRWLRPEHSRHGLRRLRCALRNPICASVTSTAEMKFAGKSQISRFIYQKLDFSTVTMRAATDKRSSSVERVDQVAKG